MKKARRLFFAAMVGMLVFPLFSSCKDDEIDGCGLTVVVKDATNPSQRIAGATITISKESGSVRRTGISDTNGAAYFFFDNEAIFDIDVEYTPDVVTRRGKSTVRLKYNEIVTKDVLVAE